METKGRADTALAIPKPSAEALSAAGISERLFLQLFAGLPAQPQPPRWSDMGVRKNMYTMDGHTGPLVRSICEHPAILRGLPVGEVLAALDVAGELDPQLVIDFGKTVDRKPSLPVKIRDLSPLLDNFGRMAMAVMTEHDRKPEDGLHTSDASMQRLPISDLAENDAFVLKSLPADARTGSWLCILNFSQATVPSVAEYAALRRDLIAKGKPDEDGYKALDDLGDWSYHDAETAASLVVGMTVLEALSRLPKSNSSTSTSPRRISAL
jgi:hypothetical protein